MSRHKYVKKHECYNLLRIILQVGSHCAKNNQNLREKKNPDCPGWRRKKPDCHGWRKKPDCPGWRKKTRLSRTEKKYYTNLNFTECALMGLSESYLAKKHLCVQYILFSYQWVCNGICLVYEPDICAQKRTASSVTVFMRRFKLFLRHGSTVHNCAFIQIGQI